ncbi:MAG: acyltransferase [Cytophagaceae bacterium]|jgi:peptidoglycan/LPS O-acetylase OafA/YrhL|nr:acyltransferase [Cytophagaceae bacterium]
MVQRVLPFLKDKLTLIHYNFNSDNINWSVLSILRFLLSFIVAAEHLKKYFNSNIINTISWFGAFEAILGFLLISGFSIGSSITQNPVGYFKRRIYRIYPVYITCLVISITIYKPLFDVYFVYLLLINLFFLNHIVINSSIIGPSWSLSLEVWLYTLAPYIRKLSYKILLSLILFSFTSYLIYTIGRSIWDWVYFSGTQWGINLILLSFMWLIGFVFAIFKNNRKETANYIIYLFLMIFSYSILIQFAYRLKNNDVRLFLSNDLLAFIGKGVLIVVILSLMYFSFKKNKLPSKVRAVFNFLGDISYPLYLLHLPVYEWCQFNGISRWFSYLGISILLSIVVYLVVDFYSKVRSSN